MKILQALLLALKSITNPKDLKFCIKAKKVNAV